MYCACWKSSSQKVCFNFVYDSFSQQMKCVKEKSTIKGMDSMICQMCLSCKDPLFLCKVESFDKLTHSLHYKLHAFLCLPQGCPEQCSKAREEHTSGA